MAGTGIEQVSAHCYITLQTSQTLSRKHSKYNNLIVLPFKCLMILLRGGRPFPGSESCEAIDVARIHVKVTGSIGKKLQVPLECLQAAQPEEPDLHSKFVVLVS